MTVLSQVLCRLRFRFLVSFFARLLSRFLTDSFKGSFSKSMFLAVIRAELATANRRPQRSTIIPATDENVELITKSPGRSFCILHLSVCQLIDQL